MTLGLGSQVERLRDRARVELSGVGREVQRYW